MLFRQNTYQTEHLWHLPELIHSLNVDVVFITGDFSSTSLDQEFSEGQKFIKEFKNRDLQVYTLPGNHDCYTRQAETHKTYYTHFPSQALRDRGVECWPLEKGWWYIGLDCACATPPFCSYGIFSEKIEEELRTCLSKIPPTDRVIIANHFPLFPSGRRLHDLKRGGALQTLLRASPQVALYLHGHDHKHYIVDKQNEGLPLTLNSGSCAHRPNGTFYLIDLTPEECLVQRLLFTPENSWSIDWQHHYGLKDKG